MNATLLRSDETEISRWAEMQDTDAVSKLKRLRILHVGPFWDGSTSLWRREALQSLGQEIIPLDITPYETSGSRLVRSIRHRLSWGPGVGKLNSDLLELVEDSRPDVVLVDKGLFIRPKTLQCIRSRSKALLVNYNNDDPFGYCRIGWRLFLQAIPFYDLQFVAREQNVAEYRARGARRVERLQWAYHPRIHTPQEVSAEDRVRLGGTVGFIGDYESDRAQCMHYLAEHGIQVRVWGPNWKRCPWRHQNLILENRPVWAAEYAKTICSFGIVLGFLRKVNRDTATSRSIEIPACGGFLLAERTGEHQQLFEEGTEAEFFSSKEELLKKVRFYLQNPEARGRIAPAGRKRCQASGYSYQDRLRASLTPIHEELSNARID